MTRAAQILFYLNGMIWLSFAIWSLARMGRDGLGSPVATMFMATLMLGNTAAMWLSGYGLGKRSKIFYYIGIVVLIVNLVLTLTDQVGLLDWITLLIDLVLVGLLLANRKSYLRPLAGYRQL
jgi:lysylphosphatidylglycerol synthetase-like protein (DUF2156 family)